MRPPITMVMSTWVPEGPEADVRIGATRRAMQSWYSRLKYDGELRLHVSDDGSIHPYWGAGVDSPPASWSPWPVTFSRQNACGVGASINAGFRQAFSVSPLAMYLADDWELFQDFDLREWSDLLMSREDFGMVNFGPPNPNVLGKVEWMPKAGDLWLDGTADAHNFSYFLHFISGNGRSTGYAFAHRPGLYHERFINRWGWFDEDGGAVWCERQYNERWFAGRGDDIVMPLYETWRHIPGTEFGLVHPPARRAS